MARVQFPLGRMFLGTDRHEGVVGTQVYDQSSCITKRTDHKQDRVNAVTAM